MNVKMDFTNLSEAGSGALPTGAEDKLREFLGPGRRLGRVAELPFRRVVQDYCDKYVALDATGQAAAFVVVSPRAFPDAVSDAASRAQAARDAAGPVVGANVLLPFFLGAPDGRSYSITAYCQPMSGHRWLGRLQRWRLGGQMLQWLEDLAAQTRAPVPASDMDVLVASPLRAIEGDAALEGDIRKAAASALESLQRDAWRPRTIVSHNDLWWGNFVHGRPAGNPGFPFYVIDWGGGSLRGTPIQDAVRLSMSLRWSPARYRRTMERHCRILECEARDTLSYLLVACGLLSQNLGEWPRDQFLQATRSCFRYASDAL